jgi:hypothetical protein
MQRQDFVREAAKFHIERRVLQNYVGGKIERLCGCLPFARVARHSQRNQQSHLGKESCRKSFVRQRRFGARVAHPTTAGIPLRGIGVLNRVYSLWERLRTSARISSGALTIFIARRL